MSARPVRLRVLLEQRHWKTHRTFSAEYNRAAQLVDPRLRGTGPSRAQLYRWLSGDLKGLPYGDHCRVLEQMFPDWTAAQLFETVSADESLTTPLRGPATSSAIPADRDVHLLTSGAELTSALIGVVRDAHECLIAVGSRSSEPNYLQEIEQAIADKPHLVHYRILIGSPHSQVLKDHMLRLLELRDPQACNGQTKRLHMSLHIDLARYYERFFVANEQDAVIVLPSTNSPMNFDTGLVVREPFYVQGLLQHGKALYSKRRLESPDAIHELEVLG